MTWSNWLLGRDRSTGPRPSVQDVTFDAMPMRVEKQGATSSSGLTTTRDRVVAAVDRSTPLPVWSLDALRAHWRAVAASRDGGIVSVTFARANEIPILEAICKFNEGPG